jgi:hypothetical protein
MQARITLVNTSKERTTVDPEKFALFVHDGGIDKALAYRSAEQVGGAIRSGVAGYAAVLNVVAGMSTQVTDSSSQAEQKKQAAAKVARVASEAENAIAKINSEALRKNTVFPGQTITGVVHFERPRNRKLVEFILYVAVGSEQLVFPFTVKRR